MKLTKDMLTEMVKEVIREQMSVQEPTDKRTKQINAILKHLQAASDLASATAKNDPTWETAGGLKLHYAIRKAILALGDL